MISCDDDDDDDKVEGIKGILRNKIHICLFYTIYYENIIQKLLSCVANTVFVVSNDNEFSFLTGDDGKSIACRRGTAWECVPRWGGVFKVSEFLHYSLIVSIICLRVTQNENHIIIPCGKSSPFYTSFYKGITGWKINNIRIKI